MLASSRKLLKMTNKNCKSVTVKYEHGIHTRPASSIVEVAMHFKNTEVLSISKKTKANAKNIMSLLFLTVQPRELLRVEAHGPQSDLAVTSMGRVLSCTEEEVECVSKQICEEIRKR